MKKQSQLLVKGMVCNRCILTIVNELKNLGYVVESIKLGEVNLQPDIEVDQNAIEKRLAKHGFSLLEDRNTRTVKQVKQLVEEVYSGYYDFPDNFRFADLVRKRWYKNYEVVSDTFIALEKKSLERYIIEYRIGKVKELLVYTNLSLADIAFRLNFNGTSHLSTQFKQVTGFTPSFCKEIKRQQAEVFSSVNLKKMQIENL